MFRNIPFAGGIKLGMGEYDPHSVGNTPFWGVLAKDTPLRGVSSWGTPFWGVLYPEIPLSGGIRLRMGEYDPHSVGNTPLRKVLVKDTPLQGVSS